MKISHLQCCQGQRPQVSCVIAGCPLSLECLGLLWFYLLSLYTEKQQQKNPVKNCMQTVSVTFSSFYLTFPHYCSSFFAPLFNLRISLIFCCGERNPLGRHSSPLLAPSCLSVTTWRPLCPLCSSHLPSPCSPQPLLVLWSFPITPTSPPAWSTPALLPIPRCRLQVHQPAPPLLLALPPLWGLFSPKPSLQASCHDKFAKECFRLHNDVM